MVKKKRQSKRLPAAKRYKIDRKVKEHHRKARKEAKKKGKKTKKRKDPGIPNLYPYKEQLLKEIKEKKERELEVRQRQKEQRQQEHQKKRNLHELKDDITKRTKAYEEKELAKSWTETHSQLKADPSLKAFYKEFRKVVEAADVVLEVLDARDPLGCRCFEMEQAVLASGSNKKLVLLLNKIDLVPRDNILKWLKYLRNEFPTVPFKASTQVQKHHLSRKHLQLFNESSHVLEKSSVCLGSELLMKLLGNYCCSTGIQTSITVGIVGLPNVGKSSVINSLKRDKVCTVGSVPGVTRLMQEIQLDRHIKLLDCPGIVMAESSSGDPSVSLRNCIKVESMLDVITPVEAILRRCDSTTLMMHYTIPEYSTTEEFLSHLARRFGKLKKGNTLCNILIKSACGVNSVTALPCSEPNGTYDELETLEAKLRGENENEDTGGVPDTDAAAKKVLHDWNSGAIKFFTHPPEEQTLPAHISAEIVHEWSKAFDISGLKDEEDKVLTELTEKMESALVLQI